MLQQFKLYASGLAIAAALTGAGLSMPAEAKAKPKAPKTEVTENVQKSSGWSLFNFFKKNDANAPAANETSGNAAPARKFDSELHAVPQHVSGNILVRYFKAEREIEIWQANAHGEFSKLRTFTITKMGSQGKLGPKEREGDLTTPEGIWYITRAQLAPTKSFKIPVKISYPNALEIFQKKTGSEILFHNNIGMRSDQSSTASCVAMSDNEYPEFRGYMEAAFARGQTAVQVQGFPFRMTERNMAGYAQHPVYRKYFSSIWGQLKTVYDAFESSRQQPAVAYCNTGYKLASHMSASDLCVPATTQNLHALQTVVAEAKTQKGKKDFQVAAAPPVQPDVQTKGETDIDIKMPAVEKASYIAQVFADMPVPVWKPQMEAALQAKADSLLAKLNPDAAVFEREERAKQTLSRSEFESYLSSVFNMPAFTPAQASEQTAAFAPIVQRRVNALTIKR